MNDCIPLIRAAALTPILRWMIERGRDADAALREVDLEWFPWNDPIQVIPLKSAAELLCNLCRVEGPDAPVRIVGDTGLFELAMLARVALGSRTPHQAMDRIAAAIPYHCTHEVLTTHSGRGKYIVRERLELNLDSESRHFVHQYALSLIEVPFRLTSAGAARPSLVALHPHPDLGFAHLEHRLQGTQVIPASETVEVHYPEGIADAPFNAIARDRLQRAQAGDWEPLRGDGRLSPSVRSLLRAMLPHGSPGIDRIAHFAGTSRRTFQRRLADEGTAFSVLLEDVRNEIGMALLAQSAVSLRKLSSEIGYAQQSTATRAFRRWTGEPPRRLRQAASQQAIAMESVPRLSGSMKDHS